MKRRRTRQQVEGHNWVAVAIELAIVIVGVFLGLQANNWNAARLDRARADSYHVRLIEDLRKTELGTQVSVAYYRQVRLHALTALRALDRPASELGVPFLVDVYQATQIFPRSVKHSTYDEILSSGNAELMGSPALRERVANFYWRMDGLISLTSVIPAYRSRVRSLMPYDVQTLIRAQCDEILTDSGAGLWTARLPENCEIVLLSADVTEAVAAVKAAPGLKQDLTGTMLDLDSKILNFGKVESGAADLRHYLENNSQ